MSQEKTVVIGEKDIGEMTYDKPFPAILSNRLIKYISDKSDFERISLSLDKGSILSDDQEDLSIYAMAIVAKNRCLYEHSLRVTMYALLIAEELGLGKHYIHEIRCGGPLHDIGKIYIPDRILNKPGKLTDAEWEVMRTHPKKGHYILGDHLGAQIAYCHHERIDGYGYTSGLLGREIPITAKVVSAVDAFDAMSSIRPYRRGMPIEEALRRIEKDTGTQFCPDAASALRRVCNGQRETIERIMETKEFGF